MTSADLKRQRDALFDQPIPSGLAAGAWLALLNQALAALEAVEMIVQNEECYRRSPVTRLRKAGWAVLDRPETGEYYVARPGSQQLAKVREDEMHDLARLGEEAEEAYRQHVGQGMAHVQARRENAERDARKGAADGPRT